MGRKANYEDEKVNGSCDLIDFFPVWLDISATLSNYPPANGITYNLHCPANALRFVYTDLSRTNAGDYLTKEVASWPPVHSLSKAGTIRIPESEEGITLDTDFLNLIAAEPDKGVLIMEAVDALASGSLVITVVSNDTILSYAELPLCLTGVEDMYRVKNLRPSGLGGRDLLDNPPNRPDAETSGKDFVFVHGYNVSPIGGRAAQAEVFKRMHQSGFNGRFWGVLWYGDVRTDLIQSHYHNSVIEAFAVAPKLRAFLTDRRCFSSPPDLAAHSLGNGVVGAALNDAPHGGQIISNYFALDAAMALEAFGDNSKDTNMVFSGDIKMNLLSPDYKWKDYPEDSWASEWHTLFGASDHRRELTWRNRCTGAVDRVSSAYNFYSSSEEVLRVNENEWGYWQAIKPAGCNSWQIQELYKGQNRWLPEWIAGGSSPYCGWGLTKNGSSTNVFIGFPFWIPEIRSPEWVAQQLANNSSGYKAALRRDPLFRSEPQILFSSDGSAFVNGKVNLYKSLLDYAPDSVGEVRIRDYLLAKAFPARTRPMGSAPIAPGLRWTDNYDMASSDQVNENGLMLHGWPRTTKYNDLPEWRHSDFKDVAYIYVQELYKTWVQICEPRRAE